jgi:hypothetical protein
MIERAPLLWLPKIKELVVPARFRGVGIAGFYKMEARKPDGRIRPLTGWFPNLITNGGLDQYAGSSWNSTCVVGTGNTAPAFTDTQLVSQVGSTTSTNFINTGAQSSPPYYGWTQTQFNFPIGTATGNLSEVGVGTSATTLFSRALILDGGGSPTTITILSNEALYVTYQVNHYVPTTDYTNSFTLNGTTYNFTLRAATATSSSAWGYRPNDPGYLFGDGGPGGGNFSSLNVSNGSIGAITGDISGTGSGAGSASHSAYTNGTYSWAVTATWGLTNGNVSGGVSAGDLLFGVNNASRGRYQWGVTPTIPKDSSHVLTLNFTNQWVRGP